MIKLKNVEKNIELELDVDGYQFPALEEDDWCNIKLKVRQNENSFITVDPALEATDLQSILEWFNCLKDRKPPSFASLSFTEPCLEFAFLAARNNAVRFSINLNHELRPKFKMKQFGLKSDSWRVVFEIGCFDEIISGIEKSIRQFPARSN